MTIYLNMFIKLHDEKGNVKTILNDDKATIAFPNVKFINK